MVCSANPLTLLGFLSQSLREQNSLDLAKIQNIFGEGNGTPLQYSCLGNPMDGGAWWAAIYGTRLT